MNQQPPRSSMASPMPGDDRRNFFVKAGAVLIGGVLAIFPLLVGGLAFFDPLRRKTKPVELLRLAALNELPENGLPMAVSVIGERNDAWNRYADEPLGRAFLRRLADEKSKPHVVALSAECPHAGCSVSLQTDADEPTSGRYQCPCHNSAFELDGAVIQPSPSPREMDELECQVLPNPQGELEVWVRFETFVAGKAEKKPKS